jgi:Ca-activated chloride channel family protein
MLNPRWFDNSRPDGLPVLQIQGEDRDPFSFVPLKGTELRGTISGPLAELELVQLFSFSSEQSDKVVEALYRFPLPGDAAVLCVAVRFGEVEIETELKPRKEAEKEYEEAKKRGDQAALASRESPDVFTLKVAGVAPDEQVTIITKYIQLGDRWRSGFNFRIPLTTAPRYVRSDERYSPYALGQPLAVLRDPGHRFSLSVSSPSGRLTSPTHKLSSSSGQVSLEEGDVIPDRDCVLIWEPESSSVPTAHLFLDEDKDGTHFLALISPPTSGPGDRSKEMLVLVDHSGSMEGAKWAATDWAVVKLLEGLGPGDFFNLCLFHSVTKWFQKGPVIADRENIARAISFLGDRSSGGTELGVALEQAMRQPAAKAGLIRQVLVLTDAQVSDEGRILEVVERGAGSDEPRRTSIICIDSAPNSYLAKQMARKGRGICRFLSSSPDEVDITSALEGVLAEMCAPLLGPYRLEFDAEIVNVLDSPFHNSRSGGIIDLSDLRLGSSAYLVGQLRGRRRPAARLVSGGSEEEVSSSVVPGVRSLYGAGLVNELERLMLSSLPVKELMEKLEALGIEVESGEDRRLVYHENEQARRGELIEKALVDTSLAYGVASSATSFIAVRRGAGKRIEGTTVVGNALPHSWSEGFLFGAAPMAMRMMAAGPVGALGKVVPRSGVPSADLSLNVREEATAMRARRFEVFAGVPDFEGERAVLFDSTRGVNKGTLPEDVLLAHIKATCDGEVKEGVDLLLFAGDLSLPALTVDLAELVRKGGRPINLRVRKGDEVLLVLVDRSGGEVLARRVEVSLSS